MLSLTIVITENTASAIPLANHQPLELAELDTGVELDSDVDANVERINIAQKANKYRRARKAKAKKAAAKAAKEADGEQPPAKSPAAAK